MTNNAFFTVVTFSKINSFADYNSIVIQIFIISNIQKHFYQDNLSLVCLQFYKHNRLNILGDNICFHIQVKNQ